MNWKGFCRKRSWPNFKVLSRHFPGGTEGNENPQSGKPVVAADNRRIRRRCVNRSTTTFGEVCGKMCYTAWNALGLNLPYNRGSQNVWRPPGWGGGGSAVGPLGWARVVCLRDIFILYEIYILVLTLLGLNMKLSLFCNLNFTKVYINFWTEGWYGSGGA
jgi:hypothetical protein